MKKILIYSTIVLLIFSSCKNNNELKTENVVKDSVKVSKSEYSVSGTLWYQTSAEAKALYIQSYNLATFMLDKNIKIKSKKKKAVITDIDETLLDNSPMNARLAKIGELYTDEAWENWVKQGKAKALPGALEFFNYCKKKGVEVFYLSNRSIASQDITMKNLLNEGFPYVDIQHMYLKEKSSDKTARRDSILKNYEVILYLGDNLRDFSEDYGQRGDDYGAAVVNDTKNLFGTKFIVFPNPMYGEWEKAIYKNDYSKSDEEKAKLRKEALQDNY